ncbi:uncharacterized protein LOC135482024 [Liolophura sinensis]|uniref:uncharacterized protein LOC135482024 n=1 Tax=Liolophura sinensis TaxID=3198878 RepID=UPI003158FADA
MAIGVSIVLMVLGSLGIQAAGPYFRGGSLRWRVHNVDKVHNNYNVSFTYQLMWTLGEGPCGKHCSETSVGISGPATGPENFICEKGCKGQTILSDTSYSVSAVSQADQWEQGIGSFSVMFGHPGPFTVAIEGHDWVPLKIETDGQWRLQTELTLGVRSDTGQPNASPLTFNIPVYKVYVGCLTPIRIMTLDPDADRVRCRFARTRKECGGVCNSFPGVELDPVSTDTSFKAQHVRVDISFMVEQVLTYP